MFRSRNNKLYKIPTNQITEVEKASCVNRAQYNKLLISDERWTERLNIPKLRHEVTNSITILRV